MLLNYLNQRKIIKIIEQEITEDFSAVVQVKNLIVHENGRYSQFSSFFIADFERLCDWIIFKKDVKQVNELVQEYSSKMKNVLNNYQSTRSFENHKKCVLYGELNDDYWSLFKTIQKIVEYV